MSDEQKTVETGGGSGKKTIILVAAMLIAEAIAIVGIMFVLKGPPAASAGVPGIDEGMVDEGEKTVEITLLHEKLSNNRGGRLFIYDTEIIMTVKQKHQTRVEELLESRRGELRAGINRIFAAAEHTYFSEPGFPTLTRQTREFLRSVFGTDARQEELVQEVLIPSSTGFPADF